MATLTRASLADAVHHQLGLSRSESGNLVEAVLNEMGKTMIAGESVKISSFGTFNLRDKKERIGRNPKSGVEVPITPRRVVTFRASNMLKDKIAEASKSSDMHSRPLMRDVASTNESSVKTDQEKELEPAV